MPLVGQAYVLPQYVGRVGVERPGDEGDVLERGEGEVGDDELEQFAGKRFELCPQSAHQTRQGS